MSVEITAAVVIELVEPKSREISLMWTLDLDPYRDKNYLNPFQDM